MIDKSASPRRRSWSFRSLFAAHLAAFIPTLAAGMVGAASGVVTQQIAYQCQSVSSTKMACTDAMARVLPALGGGAIGAMLALGVYAIILAWRADAASTERIARHAMGGAFLSFATPTGSIVFLIVFQGSLWPGLVWALASMCAGAPLVLAYLYRPAVPVVLSVLILVCAVVFVLGDRLILLVPFLIAPFGFWLIAGSLGIRARWLEGRGEPRVLSHI